MVFFGHWFLASYFVDWGTGPNQRSRSAMTLALVESGRLEIDKYEPVMGMDKAKFNGHFYSEKAPLAA